MVYGAVPVKDEENPLLGVRSSSKRPRSFAYGVIAVVCVAALAISGVSRATDESSREDHLSALGDLSNDYLAKRSWWQDVKTANETLITAKQASDKAMEEGDYMASMMALWTTPFLPNLLNTCVFLVETAVALAEGAAAAPGVLTPASALGAPLLARLRGATWGEGGDAPVITVDHGEA